MEINYCLILAAGLGTRMGEVGKTWPKVLWPVFEKSLLSLQVSYARYLGVKKIYINLFHMSDLILSEAKKDPVFEGVIFLKEEPEILDIGGAIHNLASRSEISYFGRLLILNGDQFLFIERSDFIKLTNSNDPKLLFSYKVNSSSGYNALELNDKNQVIGIVNNKDLEKNTEVMTYTGNSVVDLSSLSPVAGVSRFFDSVCILERGDVYSRCINNQEYWDFGTVSRYWYTLRKVLKMYKENSLHPFIRFLVENKALKTWKINLTGLSYHASSKEVINLNQNPFLFESPAGIILSGFPKNIPDKPFIYRDEVFSYLEE